MDPSRYAYQLPPIVFGYPSLGWGFHITSRFNSFIDERLDVILGMGWLATYRVVMYCFNKTIKLTLQSDTFGFMGQRISTQTCLILALKAERLLKFGCEGYLAFIRRINSLNGWRASR